MAGKRTGTNGDFDLSNQEANRLFGANFTGVNPPANYTWHHMDDMTIDANGDAWCTMQLVDRTAHTGVPGMAHSGSVAQFKAFFINLANSPNNLFYTN